MFRNVLTGAAALLLSAAFVPQAQAQSVAGAYLAGRHAAVQSDYSEAARYYAEALARDSNNVELIESTVLSYLSLGRVEQAVPLARVLEQKNETSQVARMVITADLAAREEYTTLLERRI
ncbi:hypothetical protein [Sulfitobacter geojensis]|uniref:hypothetical protein n=1 Tax=Sulfitobacter geojensis TaxID=1342299 RepID=UPI0036DAD777